jgi:copper resistance protein C
MRPQQRICRVLAAATAAAVLAVLAGTLPAAAHAELVSSTPAAGGTVQELAGAVTLTFSETVRTPAFVQVTGPSGSDIARGGVRVRDADLTQPVQRSTDPGQYAVAYRVTSADGHPISGTVRFTLAAPAGGDDPAQSAAPQPAPSPPAQSQPDAGGGGLGTGQLVVLLAALAVGLGALAVGTRRALRHSVAMVEDGKSRRSRRT